MTRRISGQPVYPVYRMGRGAHWVMRCAGVAIVACCTGLVAGCAGGEDASSGSSSAALAFTEVTEEAGIGAYRHESGDFGQKWMPEVVGPGGAFLDYDGDGWQDILLVGGGRWARVSDEPVEALRLYRNLGDGTFEDVSVATGLSGMEAYGFGVAAADYDNDGDTDFFLTTLHENLLFRNDGGRFEEVGEEAGLADEAYWSTSAAFFDADRDGWVDLFVGNYVSWTPETDIPCFHDGDKAYCTPQNYAGVASAFYRNQGDGSFVDATQEAGFSGAIDPVLDKTLGVTELDVTGDGHSDLYVANDTERNLLFVNRGDGTFDEVAVRSGVAYDQHGQSRAGMGVDAGVVDSTGQTTIFVGNFTQETVSVFRHASGGYFTDRATISRIGFPTMGTLTFGLFLFDADLDGDLDLFLANGHVLEHIAEILEGATFAEPAQLFLNRGDGVFEEALSATGVLAQPMVARGAAYADYDRDGDLDVLLLENAGPAHLWRNDLNEAGWLHVRLEGRVSNGSALGARIEAVAGDLRMERRIRSGSSFLSQSAFPAVFGLGARRQVDSLIVHWPSGLVERFAGVEAGQEVILVEGSGALRPAEPAVGRSGGLR